MWSRTFPSKPSSRGLLHSSKPYRRRWRWWRRGNFFRFIPESSLVIVAVTATVVGIVGDVPAAAADDVAGDLAVLRE